MVLSSIHVVMVEVFPVCTIPSSQIVKARGLER